MHVFRYARNSGYKRKHSSLYKLLYIREQMDELAGRYWPPGQAASHCAARVRTEPAGQDAHVEPVVQVRQLAKHPNSSVKRGR